MWDMLVLLVAQFHSQSNKIKKHIAGEGKTEAPGNFYWTSRLIMTLGGRGTLSQKKTSISWKKSSALCLWLPITCVHHPFLQVTSSNSLWQLDNSAFPPRATKSQTTKDLALPEVFLPKNKPRREDFCLWKNTVRKRRSDVYRTPPQTNPCTAGYWHG